MAQRPFRYLMLWLFVALQAITPFIHAHAGTVQLDHAGFMHLHQGGDGDVARHGAATDEHGTEVAVAAGVPLRPTLVAAHADQPLSVARAPHRVQDRGPGQNDARPPPVPDVPPLTYTRPHVLAPPVR